MISDAMDLTCEPEALSLQTVVVPSGSSETFEEYHQPPETTPSSMSTYFSREKRPMTS